VSQNHQPLVDSIFASYGSGFSRQKKKKKKKKKKKVSEELILLHQNI
jgi:hypothetical protein